MIRGHLQGFNTWNVTDIRTIPVSTISFEFAFSLSGMLLDDRCQSLTPAHVERLSLIKD
jgi:hypothetical protein